MNRKITLIIGDTDVSKFTECENYSVNKVWKISDSFTAFDGSTVTRRCGWNYRLRAKLYNIPDEFMRKLTAELDRSSITVTFTDPHSKSKDLCTTDSFMRGTSTGGTVFCELDDGLRWDMEIALDSEFHNTDNGEGGSGVSGGL